jgi:hypothetical protein
MDYSLRPRKDSDFDLIYRIMESGFKTYVEEMFGAWEAETQK